jgi:hypothetical protein
MLIEDHHITLTSLKEFTVLVDKYDMEHLVQILQKQCENSITALCKKCLERKDGTMYDLFAELFVGRRLNLTELFYRGVDGLIIGSGLENGRFYVTSYENCKLQRPLRVFVDEGEPGIEVDVDIIGTSSILLCKQMAKLTAKDYCNRVRAIWKKETVNLYVAIEDYAWDMIEWNSSSDARDLHI